MCCVEYIELFIEFVIRASWLGIFFSVIRLPGFCKVQGKIGLRNLEAGEACLNFRHCVRHYYSQTDFIAKDTDRQ